MTYYVFLDTTTSFKEICQPLLESSLVVGIDAEWPPFESRGPPKACLLQVACLVLPNLDPTHASIDGQKASHVERHVFVIDVRSISEDGESGFLALKDVFRGLLRNPGCLKIGHSLDADIKATSCALDLPIQGVLVTCAVDVKHLFTKLWHMRAPGLHGTCKDKGLSVVLETVLGMTLDKSLQCSDWGQRPLTDEQILYAANDASCLLDLFMSACYMYDGKVAAERGQGTYCMSTLAVLHDTTIDTYLAHTCVSEFGQEWTWSRYGKLLTSKRSAFWNNHQVVGTAQRMSGGKKKKKKKRIVQGGILPENVPWDMETGQAKFICDVMLEGLAKQLRLWGVDCEMSPALSKSERYLTHRKLVEIAEEQSRVILTKDSILYTRRISDQMYFVTNDLKQEQTEEVLKRFNVQVGVQSLMSRCSACNGSFHSTPRNADQLPKNHGLPDAVLEHVDEFWVCSLCDSHIYWKGGQYRRSMDKLTDDFKRMFSSQEQ